MAIFTEKKNESVASLGVPEAQKMEVPPDKKEEKPAAEAADAEEADGGSEIHVPDIPEPPQATGAVLVVFKIVAALVIAGGTAGAVSFVMGISAVTAFSAVFSAARVCR